MIEDGGHLAQFVRNADDEQQPIPKARSQRTHVRIRRNDTEFGPVIHIIQTRFMQFQPNLTELGLARVSLFETFSLPTMLRQSSQNYLWILRTDPKLHHTVKQQFIALVQPYSNIYVIASNDNPEGFRSSKYMADIRKETVWNGDYDLLLRARKAAKTRLLLESRLDADDGLYTDFIADLQMDAVKYFALPTNQATSWKLWCSHVYLDWQLVSPWKKFDPPEGVLSAVRPGACVTPGLTVGYSAKAKRRDFPGGAHHVLKERIPPCNEDNGHLNCLSLYPPSTFSAIRARTVTSAGMGDVILESRESRLTEEQMKQFELVQEKLWLELDALFGVTKERATNTRSVLAKQLSTVASENLKGQCIKGFTCKESSRTMLKHVVASKQFKGGRGK